MADTRAEKPIILLLCLGGGYWTGILDGTETFVAGINLLLQKARLKRAKTLSAALDYLDENRPDGILIADTGVVAQENREILGRLTAFAKSGGTVVYSFCFASGLRPGVMNQHWDQTWKLPWKTHTWNWTTGKYQRTTFELNRSAICTTTTQGRCSSIDNAANRQSLLLSQYNQKAVCLSQVYPENRWYVPTSESRLESSATPPDPLDCIADLSGTPVAFTRIGDGYLGYTGDVHQETGTNLVLFRMFNLDAIPAVEEL